MKQLIELGTTSKMITVFIQSSTSSSGGGLTGLAYNSAGLVWNYLTEDGTGTTSVTLATMTVGTWASGGFVQISSVGLPGFYEIGLPNALTTNTTTTRSWAVMQLSGAAGMIPVNVEIQFTGWNPSSTNITANVQQWLGTAVTSNAGIPIVDVAAGTINTVTGTVTATVPTLSTNVNVVDWLGTAVTSNAGVPIVDVAGGTVTTVTGNVLGTVAAVTTCSNVGTVTSVSSATVVGTPTVNVVEWDNAAVITPIIAGAPIVDNGYWLGSVPIGLTYGFLPAVTSLFSGVVLSSGSNIILTTGIGLATTSEIFQGALITVLGIAGHQSRLITGYASSTTTGTATGTFTVTPNWTVAPGAGIDFIVTPWGGVDVEMWQNSTSLPVSSTNVNVTEWLGTAVTSNAGIPVVYTTNTVAATVAGTVTATVPTEVLANVTEWLGTAVTSSAGVPVVYTTNTVTATVIGGTIATVSGNVVGTVGSVTAPVTIATGQLTIKRNTALSGFTFPMYNGTGGPQTGLTVSGEVSIDGAAIVNTVNSPTEVGQGLYSLNLSPADVNGTVITFILTASGASTTIITVITQA